MNNQPLLRLLPTYVSTYGAAFLLTVGALVIATAMDDLVGGHVMFIFLGAVVLSAFWGGLGPGLTASVLSIAFADHFLIVPARIIQTNSDRLFLLLAFSALAAFISWIGARRTRSEQALQVTKAQLETIRHGVTDGITVQNRAGQLTFANEAAAELFGYPSATALVATPTAEARSRFELFDEHGKTLPVAKLPGWQAMTEGVSIERTLLMRPRGGGEERWLLIKSAPVLDSNGKANLTVNLLQDVTARKKSEEERLRLLLLTEQQRRRIQNLVDNVPGIVWEMTWDPGTGKQEFVFVSSHSEKLIGYAVDEWLTNPDFWRTVVHPDDWQDAVDQTTALLESGKPGIIEFRFVAKDGREVPIEAHMTILTDDARRPIGACGVFMDVSERKQVEANLARYAVELKRSNDELEQFAYAASHDLQEPLRMVGSYLQLIENRYVDRLDDEGREFIAFAVDGAARMKDLISGLLTYSRVDAQPQKFSLIDCGKVFDNACKLLQVAIEESQAAITSDALPQIRADERLMIQLFQNLIANAIKYRSERKPEIHVEARREKGHWTFSVRDNGIGIEAQYLDRIFMIFQRLHARSKYPGTGIGLAICRKVVERHGGRIWAESKVGEGTTMYFTIPA